jgi:hypothetical protein
MSLGEKYSVKEGKIGEIHILKREKKKNNRKVAVKMVNN